MKDNNENEKMYKEILLKSGIIHDLRNLLMIMKEVVEQIKSAQNDIESIDMINDDMLKKLNYVCSLCDYCIYLTKVKDLFKKIDPNDSNNAGFDISETIKFCQNIFNERATYDTNKDNLQVIYEEKDDKYPTIPLNRKIKSMSEIQFKTVLINFLSNAYKYTDSGSIKIKTRMFNKKKEKKQKLRIMVEDSGTGFKGINIEMNKPYHYHDKGKKNKEGSGFGLYMVTEILKTVNSNIKYQTSEAGSMFYFDLIETSPFNEIIDLTKMYSSYLRQLIDDINAGKKDDVNIIDGNLENKISEEETKNKTKSPQINKHKYIMYPHNNAIINLLGTDKKLSIIKEKSIRKQISMRKVLKKQNKSIFKIDKRKIQGLNSYNFNLGDETFRDNQNIDAIGGVQDIMEEEDNRPLFTVIICDDEGMICESIKRILKNIFENNDKFNDKYNLDILIASDGIKCLNLVCEYVSKHKPIKFILMDNSMPYLDGITTCNLIKNSPVLNQTIYLLSGDDNCDDCKADGFLVKPLDEDELSKIINKFY